MSEFSINENLENNTLQFLKSNLFCDITLKSGEEKMNSHKIILMKESSWFNEFLKKNISVKQIDIAYDPDKVLFKVIEAIYSEKLEIDLTNFAKYLNIAYFYGFNSLKVSISKYIKKVFNKENALNISQNLCNYRLDEEAVKYSNILYDIYNKLESKTYFYKCVSPIVFASVLKHVKDNFYLKKNNRGVNEVLFENIEEFVEETKSIKTEEDKKALASLIAWDSKSYLFLVKYEASWVPASISRGLYSEILTLRRKSTKGMIEDAKKVTKSTTKWFPISWLSTIAKTTGVDKTPTINVVELMSTIGHSQKFNPVPYDLINVSGSKSVAYGTAAEHVYSIKNVFSNNSRYYLSKEGSGIDKPYVCVDFGKGTKIEMSSLTVYSDSPYEISENDDKITRHHHTPKKLLVEVGLDAEPTKEIGFVELTNGEGSISFNKHVNFNTIKFTMEGSSTANWWNLRIAGLEVIGKFLSN